MHRETRKSDGLAFKLRAQYLCMTKSEKWRKWGADWVGGGEPQNMPAHPPQTQRHALSSNRIVFSVSPQVEAPSEIGPSGKTRSPSDLSCFVVKSEPVTGVGAAPLYSKWNLLASVSESDSGMQAIVSPEKSILRCTIAPLVSKELVDLHAK